MWHKIEKKTWIPVIFNIASIAISKEFPMMLDHGYPRSILREKKINHSALSTEMSIQAYNAQYFFFLHLLAIGYLNALHF